MWPIGPDSGRTSWDVRPPIRIRQAAEDIKVTGVKMVEPTVRKKNMIFIFFAWRFGEFPRASVCLMTAFRSSKRQCLVNFQCGGVFVHNLYVRMIIYNYIYIYIHVCVCKYNLHIYTQRISASLYIVYMIIWYYLIISDII